MISHEIVDYIDVFFKENAEKLSEHKESDHIIELNEQDSPFEPLYNLSNSELKTLWKYLDDALTKEWIRHFISSAKAPVLFILKKNDGFHLCVNYQALNKITIKNHHTLPLINETLNQLVEARWFTKFDLKNAYHQLHIKYDNEWKMVFHMWYDHFEYMIIPFDLFNAPVIFQTYINKALINMIDVFYVVYLDDILIYSSSLKKHWGHIR